MLRHASIDFTTLWRSWHGMMDLWNFKVSQDWVSWPSNLIQVEQVFQTGKEHLIDKMLKMQSLHYLLNTISWSQPAQGCTLNWEGSWKKMTKLGHVSILLNIFKKSLTWRMFPLTTKLTTKLVDYLMIMRNWQCSPMLLSLRVIIWRMIPRIRKSTNATDTGKLCSVNWTKDTIATAR